MGSPSRDETQMGSLAEPHHGRPRAAALTDVAGALDVVAPAEPGETQQRDLDLPQGHVESAGDAVSARPVRLGDGEEERHSLIDIRPRDVAAHGLGPSNGDAADSTVRLHARGGASSRRLLAPVAAGRARETTGSPVRERTRVEPRATGFCRLTPFDQLG